MHDVFQPSTSLCTTAASASLKEAEGGEMGDGKGRDKGVRGQGMSGQVGPSLPPMRLFSALASAPQRKRIP